MNRLSSLLFNRSVVPRLTCHHQKRLCKTNSESENSENSEISETTNSASHPLMQFFDSPENWGESVVRVGRPWRLEELRIKSNSDLHKLWYILLKERNMLLTMQEAYKNQSRVLPSEERIEKVEESMENLEKIVRERNKAYFQLEVGEDATAERSQAFRPDQFGRWRWQPIYEHYRPYRVSKNWRTVFGPAHGKDVTEFLHAYGERRRNRLYGILKAQHHIVKNLLRRFPDIDINHLQQKYPQVPVQYYKDNLNFEPEYRRLVSKGAYEESH